MDIFVTITLASILPFLLCVFLFVYRKKHSTAIGRPLPGPDIVPAEILSGDMVATLEKLSELAVMYGDIYKLNMHGKTMVYANSTETLRKLFTTSPYHDVMNDRPPSFHVSNFYKGVESTAFNERGNDPIHKGLRRGLIRGLHVYGDGVKAFEDTVCKEIILAMDRIDEFGGDEFEFMSFISRSLANIISVLLIGSPFENSSDSDLFTRYTQSVSNMMNPSTNGILMTFPFLRHFPGYYKRICTEHERLIYEILETFFYSQKRTFVTGKTRGLVDFFLSEQVRERESGNEVLYTDGRVITSILDLVSAGNSTSRATLGSMFLCLLEYPEWQTKIQNEIDDVIGRDRLPNIDDRQSCHVTEAFCLEAQRYHNVTPLSLAHQCGKDVEYDGYSIPAGSLIFPNFWHIHHDETIWKDPWIFRPERFLDDRGQLIDRDHVFRKNSIYFGLGRRQCPAEMFARSRVFLYLASFLQRWTFLPGPSHENISSDPRKGGYIIAMSSEPKPFYCRVQPRF